jgi:hypothetical protein
MIIKVNLIAKNDQYEYVFFTFSYKKKLSSFNRSYIKTSPKIEGAEHEELEKRPEKGCPAGFCNCTDRADCVYRGACKEQKIPCNCICPLYCPRGFNTIVFCWLVILIGGGIVCFMIVFTIQDNFF